MCTPPPFEQAHAGKARGANEHTVVVLRTDQARSAHGLGRSEVPRGELALGSLEAIEDYPVPGQSAVISAVG